MLQRRLIVISVLFYLFGVYLYLSPKEVIDFLKFNLIQPIKITHILILQFSQIKQVLERSS